ncbi:hypothetical protein SAMN04487944_1179 [Gracilibacillus ureilyticus]|uniref:Uncharacterized protein n=2 Tax=Gracilibacillus ureilyticus TaxID=531814 RepID=A0A1H9UD48_9BACI|nr:hypothetical protein SAMN04487944_1179 [Gracilibacillus ureilyticus]
MKVDDLFIEDNYIKVRNNYSQSFVPWILVRGENAEHIKAYMKIRKNAEVHSGQEENFFANVWNAKELLYKQDLVSSKPYTPHA